MAQFIVIYVKTDFSFLKKTNILFKIFESLLIFLNIKAVFITILLQPL